MPKYFNSHTIVGQCGIWRSHNPMRWEYKVEKGDAIIKCQDKVMERIAQLCLSKNYNLNQFIEWQKELIGTGDESFVDPKDYKYGYYYIDNNVEVVSLNPTVVFRSIKEEDISKENGYCVRGWYRWEGYSAKDLTSSPCWRKDTYMETKVLKGESKEALFKELQLYNDSQRYTSSRLLLETKALCEEYYDWCKKNPLGVRGYNDTF